MKSLTIEYVNSCLMTYPYTVELKRVFERTRPKRETPKFFVYDRHGKKVDETYTLEEILAKYTAWQPDYVGSL
jgi:hypothetical protein